MLAVDEKGVNVIGHVINLTKPTTNGNAPASAKRTDGFPQSKSLDEDMDAGRPSESLAEINSLNEVKNQNGIIPSAAALNHQPTRSRQDTVMNENSADLDDEVSEGGFTTT